MWQHHSWKKTIRDKTIQELVAMAEAFKEERRAERAAKDARSSLEQIRDERERALLALEGSAEKETKSGPFTVSDL